MKDAMSINNNQLCTVPRAYLWSVPMYQCLLLFCPFASIFGALADLSWILKFWKKFPPLNTHMHTTNKEDLIPNIFVRRIQDYLNLLPSFDKFSDFAVYRVQS